MSEDKDRPANNANEPKAGDPEDQNRQAGAEASADNHDDQGSSGEVIPAGGALTGKGNVEVPAEALREAVGQLKHLITIRRQEAERQERAIGEMRQAIQRQGRTNSWLVFLSLVLIAVAGAGAYYFLELRTANQQVATQVEDFGGTLATTRDTVKAATEEQRRELTQVGERVNEQVGRQTELLADMGSRVEATQQVLTEQAAATQEALKTEVAATRDAVTREVTRQYETLNGLQQALSATREEQADRLAAVEAEIARTLGEAGSEQAAAVAAVREAVEVVREEQAARLAQANEEVTRTFTELASGQSVVLSSVNDQVTELRASQAQDLQDVREQLAAARAENAELTRLMDEKIRAAEDAIAAQVTESVAAVKAERDQIQAEMARLLEERMAAFAAREAELEQRQEVLQAEEERFARQAAEQRARMRALLSDALHSLEPAAPAAAQPAEAAPAQPAGPAASTPQEAAPAEQEPESSAEQAEEAPAPQG